MGAGWGGCIGALRLNMSQSDVDVGLDWSVLATTACHEVTVNTVHTLRGN